MTTERTVTVRMRALVSDYQAALGRAAASTRALSAEVSAATRKNETQFKKLGQTAGIAAIGLGAGFVMAERTIMGFDKTMSQVAAVSNASAKELKALRDAAIAAGASTKLAGVTASDAARAEAELARASVSTTDILGGALTGSLALASAGQLDFGAAATIAAQSMKIFKLQGRDVGHVADVLAAGANKSAADVGQLGDALRQGGLVAAGANQSLEQTVGTLALFADNALIGSDAGTSLKTMLLQLQGPSQKSRDLMQELGLSVYDGTGNFVGLDELAGRLRSTLGGLTVAQRDAAIAQIFGNDAARAARVLYNEGADGVREYIDAVNDQGAAERMAAKQMDNLAGDLETLGGAIEAAIIKNGSSATGALRLMTQGATGLVNDLGNLPGPLSATAVGIVGVTTAGLGVVGMAGTLIPRVREARTALEGMGQAGVLANKGLGWMGKAGAAGIGLITVIELATALEDKLMDLAKTEPDVTKVGQALYGLARNGRITPEFLNEVGGSIESLGKKINRVTDRSLGDKIFGETTLGKGALDRATEQVNALDDALAEMVRAGNADQAAQAFHELTRALAAEGVNPERVREALNGYAAALDEAKLGTTATSAATGQLGADLDGTAGSLTAGAAAADEYADALDALHASTFSVRDATNTYVGELAGFADGVRAAQAEGDRLAASLDANTLAGIQNQEALSGIVRAAFDVAEAMVAQGASTDEVATAMANMRAQLLHVLEQLGFNSTAAREYADLLLRVPGRVSTTVDIDTDLAKRKLAELYALLGNMDFNLRAIGERVLTTGTSAIPVMPRPAPISGALSDAIAGRGPRASGSASSGAGAARRAAEQAAAEAKRRAEEEKRRQEELTRFLEAHFQLRMEKLENQYKAGKISTDAYLRSLDEQIAREEPWSNEWMALQEKKKAVFEDAAEAIADAQEKAAKRAAEIHRFEKEAAEAAVRKQEQARERLVRMLEEEEGLRRQLVASAEQHRRRLGDIERKFVADQAGVLQERREQLIGWARLDEQVAMSWGNSVSALAGNVADQVAIFDEWADTLAEARRRGVSEQVIELLGLAEGPQALSQLRMFTSATEAEIADLNRQVELRARQAGQQVTAEQTSSYSKLGQTLRGLAERHAAEVEAATEDFLAQQRDLNAQLAAIGFDGGRSLSQAIADGLRSAIPAIRQAATEAAAAAAEAAAIARAIAAGPHPSGTGNIYVDPTISRAPGQTGAVVTPIVQDGRIILVPRMHGGGIVGGPQGAEVDIRAMAGERIFSVPDNKALIAAIASRGSSAPPVVQFSATLEIDGKEIPVKVKDLWRSDAAQIANRQTIAGTIR